MSSWSERFQWRLQRIIVGVSRTWHRVRRSRHRVSWVVGVVETASMVANVARAIPNSLSVALAPHPFYDFAYDIQIDGGRGSWLRRVVLGPWVFGRLVNVADGFLYVGADGFLLAGPDERRWEFSYARRHGCRIACMFVGSDIRSPRLLREFEEQTGHETIAKYLVQARPEAALPEYEERRRRIAAVADDLAHVIFNARVDQMSYLRRPTEPFPYFFPDGDVLDDLSKHDVSGARIVLHAPSSPVLKGTPAVREAVRRLKAEGYDFEYRELIDVSHGEVLANLREAHIVLNEFYAFVPGVFGVEAMASGCALLTRADETIETDLPQGSNEAWVVTTSAEVYANLKRLLDEPELIRAKADAGLAWVRKHATASVSGERIRRTLAA